MNVRLVEAFSRRKMYTSRYFIYFQEAMDVASFTVFILDLLDITFSFTLKIQLQIKII